MKTNCLAVIFLFCWLPIFGGGYGSPSPAASGVDFQFSLVHPGQLFIPGDEVRFVFSLQEIDQVTTDSFTLEVQLPKGLLLADSFWQQSGNSAYRTLSKPWVSSNFPVAITTRITPGFTGRQLSVGGSLSVTSSGQKFATLSVGEVLKTIPDTCLFLQDTSGNTVSTILATRRKIIARLRGPIDLSPTAPLRISHKKCKAFILKPGKKRARQKDKCTTLHFELTGDNTIDYPPRFRPGPEKIKDTLAFSSSIARGDTLNVAVKTVKGRLLRNITLTDRKGEILDAVEDVPGYALVRATDTTALNLALHLRARRLFGLLPVKQYCLLDVERRPAAITMFRDNGPPLQQPQGDTTVLLRKLIASKGNTAVWKSLTARRQQQQTIFYRIRETVDTTGLTPIRRDTLSQDTCDGLFNVQLHTKGVKRKTWEAVDTLMFQATDAAAIVVGKRNLLGQRQGSVEVKVPVHLNVGTPETRDSLIAVAYWIGIGPSPITAYETLAEEVPPEWGQPGVSPPLAAYGLGHPIVLPGLATSEAIFQRDRVRFDFVGSRGKSAFAKELAYTKLIRRDPKRPNSGIIDGAKLIGLNSTIRRDREAGKDILNFYLAFANQHPINTYQVQLKVVGYYQVFNRKEVWDTIDPKL